MDTRIAALDALNVHRKALTDELQDVDSAIAAMSGGNGAPATTPAPPPAQPRSEPIDKDDADQAVLHVLAQRDELQIKEIAAKTAENGEGGLTPAQVGNALKRLLEAGHVSKRRNKPAFWSLVLTPLADPTPSASPAVESGLTATEERVLLVLAKKQASDIKSDVTFGDIEDAYNFKWGDDGASSLSPAVAQLIEEKLVADHQAGEIHRYRLTVAGQAKADEIRVAAANP